MTNAEFRKLVSEMRHAQKNYFRTRSGDALDKSKRLERQVDKELADDGQQVLFQ